MNAKEFIFNPKDERSYWQQLYAFSYTLPPDEKRKLDREVWIYGVLLGPPMWLLVVSLAISGMIVLIEHLLK
jgi:hypothetical protein